ncbi:MAG: hypothetical protein HHJ16_16135 [Polaromonas sp.]|uniref:hypothetical protein n=1 Tax=Polaromonas sp. TaxID=1869339 RepID=UPI0017F7CDEE|nr:hypothetical protein [Polaromonas sp.]NMM11784.1 hypothetical protein [Polaromonas sp.]
MRKVGSDVGSKGVSGTPSGASRRKKNQQKQKKRTFIRKARFDEIDFGGLGSILQTIYA